MTQTDESEQLIKTLVDLITNKKLKVRVYTKNRLHAKTYIFEYKQGEHYETGTSIVGSSNLIPILRNKVALEVLRGLVNVRGAMNCATTNQLFL